MLKKLDDKTEQNFPELIRQVRQFYFEKWNQKEITKE
jgi:hypothetical protein